MSIELCVFGLSSFTLRTVKLCCWIHNKYDYLKLITNTIFDHYHNLNSFPAKIFIETWTLWNGISSHFGVELCAGAGEPDPELRHILPELEPQLENSGNELRQTKLGNIISYFNELLVMEKLN